MYAAYDGNAAAVCLMLKAGANPSKKDHVSAAPGLTPQQASPPRASGAAAAAAGTSRSLVMM